MGPPAARFNPPPGWPSPPPGWLPPPGWQPDPSWPQMPPGWQLVIEAESARPEPSQISSPPPPPPAAEQPPASVPERVSWWSGLRPAQLPGVRRPGSKDMAPLQVTPDGLAWGRRVKIAWSTILKIETGIVTQRQGNQRRAVGFGVLGVAAVAATAAHNAKARQVVSHREIRISCRDGQVFRFLTNASDALVSEVFGPLFAAYAAEVQRQAQLSTPAAATSGAVPPPARAPSAIGVADELAKLAGLRDSGVISAEEFDLQKAKLIGTA